MTRPPAGSPQWHRSRHSGSTGGQCVEVAAAEDGPIRIRDSKDPQGPVLEFAPGPWRAFLRGVSQGEFDLGADGSLGLPPAPVRSLRMSRAGRALRQPATFQAARTSASAAATSTPRMGCSSSAGEYLLAGTWRPSASAIART
jgi:hypothetical protein